MDKELIIKKLQTYFNSKEFVTAAYLFGSVAKNKHRSQSDVDIAVLFQDSLDLLQRFDLKLTIAADLEEILGTKTDIVDLAEVDPYFFHQIMLSKQLLIDKNTRQRVEFEVRLRREYLDRIPFYQLYHREALKRLEER
ncbi:type VII toxin-antitoxin system MntA family adenylyltransferase antitoxin [Effusibacillus lacus]|uniref:Polymerase beta nucleotidyltransferase domain-containing protein n=1 Tax=Effusibacillus lacus TaxID=1348429 RepID=A0A292YMV4_9BACL|nr:nucleotidyltransferase domain-containing protein [Effusibacillus lacus]TCS76461.1 hypothetical protein EDD64_1025 [Effusibacillus lacus]GAX90516.1 hypothetical protein EFBL_2143 [Effusibacillus lacus]